ncbi:hypothetical protein EDS67_03390 [candidate division KSB1 bacterium]|nr:MAG: hypothetical protein EDS67_03390 [candidate division KSB1 bacterium]MBC6950250.1 hypothetical protein [candidate division KSB1 bacterium]MCE7939970.1 hypothetical protein [Chlorobi bacterium CHB1]RIK59694.1 MAG: hypothetical protein DCC62_28535 [candidate division KSB1 bacterium]
MSKKSKDFLTRRKQRFFLFFRQAENWSPVGSLKSFRQDDLTAKLFQIILPLNYFAIKLSEFYSEFVCLMA